MINLFIDTNVYLDFYHLSNDDLEELNKLLAALQEKQIKLFVTEQVVDEFKRHRESKIAETLKLLDNVKLNLSFPKLIQAYPEYELMRMDIRNFSEHSSTAQSRLKSDISNNSLVPDELIAKLFSTAVPIKSTDEIYNVACKRQRLRRPPGKNDSSVGDAVNWETLLAHVPNGQDVFIVSRDSDYVSRVGEDQLALYLGDEWSEVKGSTAVLYKNLKAFFDARYPGIKLATDLKRHMAVQCLVSSENFVSTHRYINRLKSFQEFTDDEARDLFDASLTNNQVFWLGEDSDVNSFIRNLMNNKAALLDEEEIARLNELYPLPQVTVDSINFDDIPF